MSNTITLPFNMKKMKMIADVKLISKRNSKPSPFKAFLDTGSTDTVMSTYLFKELGFQEQSRIKVTVTGINGISEGFSTIIDHFIIGDVDLGKTRITVTELSPAFKNNIVLGMNVLVWFNMLVSHTQKEITLAERQIKNIDRESRFYRTDIYARNILANIIEE